MATVSQDSSVVTITPRSEDSAVSLGYDGSATLTFKASDGISQATVQNTFTLSFNTDWATASLTETRFQPSDIANSSQFGHRNLGISGDGLYIACGSPVHNSSKGKGYIFFYNGSSWAQQADFANPDNVQTGFGGGSAIDGDGDVALFSQPGHSTYAGAVHVYTRSGTSWTLRTRLVASDAASYDFFAGGEAGQNSTISISKDGTYIIVGAPGEDTGASLAGSAYIFTGSGASWSQQAILRSPASTASDNFGFSVRINADGTYAVVGATGDNGTNVGAAYIFTRSGTSWSQQAKLSASDGAAHDQLGHAVAISGDGMYAALAAKHDDDNYTSSGSVYVYVRSGTSWSQQQKINLGASGIIYNYFGSSIDMNEAGDLLAIGSGGENTNQIGKVRVYKRTGSTWALVKTIGASDEVDVAGQGNVKGFAQKVAISGNGNVVTASAYPDTNANGRGSVYVYNA